MIEYFYYPKVGLFAHCNKNILFLMQKDYASDLKTHDS